MTDHNLITFKSHRETLDAWALKELIGHYVAYRKLVSKSPADLLPEEHFRLYAVSARFPQNLSGQVPWQERSPGVYDCKWGTDTVRVVVAGRLPKDSQNAPLHLFSASQDLIGFGSERFQRRSEDTSGLLIQLFDREGFKMSYTMEDFRRDFIKEHVVELPAKDQEEVLRKLLPESLLATLPMEQIREHLKRQTPGASGQRRKQRKKK